MTAAPLASPPLAPPRLPALAGLLGWSVLGIALAALLVLAVADMNRLALIGLITVPVLTLVLVNVEFGLSVLLVYSSVLAFLIRMLPPANSGPIGIALDGLLCLMLGRLLLDLAIRRDWRIFASPLTLAVTAFLAYQCIEVFNPAAPSIIFGLYGLRVTLRITGFFLVIYYLREKAAIMRVTWLWLGLMIALGAYGIFQHVHGLLWQEMAWLLTEGNAQTHILGGYVRVFSTVGDAATFGFLMIMGTLMAFALAPALRGPRQWLLIASTLPMLYALVVSYSRGPMVALAAGAAAMILASRNWRLGLALSAVGGLGLVLLIASGSTKLVNRVATATNPTEDASWNVRMGYVTTYLPEIAKRPFGFGVNTSGGGALRVAGGAQVRKSVVGVPTDNYYFKVALELGWVGLGLWVWLQALALAYGYRVYRATADPQLKAVALGLLSVLACLAVGALSNDIIAQKPISEYYWMALGLLVLIGQHASARSDGVPLGSLRPAGFQPPAAARPTAPETG